MTKIDMSKHTRLSKQNHRLLNRDYIPANIKYSSREFQCVVRKHCSAQSPGLSLRLQQCENITLSDWSLDISHDKPVLVVKKLNSHLSHLSSGSSTTHDFHHDSMLGTRFHSANAEYTHKTSQ